VKSNVFSFFLISDRTPKVWFLIRGVRLRLAFSTLSLLSRIEVLVGEMLLSTFLTVCGIGARVFLEDNLLDLRISVVSGFLRGDRFGLSEPSSTL